MLAGNLASRSGFDVAAELDRLHVAFVLLAPGGDALDPTRQRIVDALDGNRILTPITTGALWSYDGLGRGEAPTGPAPLATTSGAIVIAGQALVLFLAVLLAVPTTRRRRVRAARATEGAQPVEEAP